MPDFSLISLAKSNNAPQVISDEANVRIRRRPEIVSLKVEVDDIRQMLIEKKNCPLDKESCPAD